MRERAARRSASSAARSTGGPLQVGDPLFEGDELSADPAQLVVQLVGAALVIAPELVAKAVLHGGLAVVRCAQIGRDRLQVLLAALLGGAHGVVDADLDAAQDGAKRGDQHGTGRSCDQLDPALRRPLAKERALRGETVLGGHRDGRAPAVRELGLVGRARRRSCP